MQILKSILFAAILFSPIALTPNAQAAKFACSKISGSGAGDFDFREICIADEGAVLTVGTFESSTHLYSVHTGREAGGEIFVTLRPLSANESKPLDLILRPKGTQRKLQDAMNVLSSSAVIMGDPLRGRAGGNYKAEDFGKSKPLR